MKLTDGEIGYLYQINMNSKFWDGVIFRITEDSWHTEWVHEVTIEIVRTNLLGVVEGRKVIRDSSNVGLSNITTIGKLEDYPEYFL